MKRLIWRAVAAGVIALMSLVAGAQSNQAGSKPAVPQQTDPHVQGQAPAMPQQQQGDTQDQAKSPAEELTRGLTAALNLSDTQSAKVKAVLEEEHGKMMSLRDDPTLSLEDKQAKWLVIRQDASQQIVSILSPEQQQKLVQLLHNSQQQQDDEEDATPAGPPNQSPARPPQKN